MLEAEPGFVWNPCDSKAHTNHYTTLSLPTSGTKGQQPCGPELCHTHPAPWLTHDQGAHLALS